MPAPLRRLLAACLSLGVLVVPAASPPAVAQGNSDPFAVTLTSMTPAAITSATQRGRLVVRGSVRNTAHEDWTNVTVYLAPEATPLTTESDLSAALGSGPPTSGARLIAQAVALPDLPAGESADFTLSVPIRALGLTSGPGVYPLTVEVLGTGPQGYDEQPDGVALTLLPLMRPGADPASLSIVVPFRAAVARGPDGSLRNLSRWVSRVAPGGRLDNVLGFALQSSIPVSLLVDPAVLDAVSSVSAGNPATGEQGSPGVEPEAADWLRSFQAVAGRSTVLSLPYGDVDVGSALDNQRQDLLTIARDVTQSILSAYRSVPITAPKSGTLTVQQLRELSPGDHVLLDAQALPTAHGTTVATRQGASVTLTNAVVGRPPTSADSLVQLRQTLLAELAVRSLSGTGPSPVVISFPAHWRAPAPDRSGEFFSGLVQPWVRGVALPVGGPDDPVVGAGHFVVPEDPVPAVPFGNFVVAQALIQDSTALSELLGDPAILDAGERQALVSVSENIAPRPKGADERASAAVDVAKAALNKVSVSGPSFVTMSSGTGSFQVTITNKLDQDVTVGLSATVSTPDLTVRPIDPVTVAAGQQRSVRVTLASHHLGVYRVTLHPVTTEGTPLPSTLDVSVRGSQIGQIIWVILGAAACLLFVTIGLRLVRRIRGRRA